MPLLDHFRPPVSEDVQWNSFHSNWATRIADRLGEIMPLEFFAHENPKLDGGLEMDVAAVRRPPSVNGAGTPSESDWQPPPAVSTGISFPDRYEVLVFRQFGGKQVVGAIELVSPSNKSTEENRTAFVSKVVSYLHEAINVVVVDVVTERRAILHDEIARTLDLPQELMLPLSTRLYAASYRPVVRDGRPQLDTWVTPIEVGGPLPTMPLRLISDYFVPVELELTYTEACRRRRLIP